jgi:hypothetical protein
MFSDVMVCLQAQHSSRGIEQQVITGCELLETVHQLEEQFSLEPSFPLLEAMMTLMRQAVECLGEAQDSRYQSALQHMQSFLSRADVIRLLDEKRAMELRSEVGSVVVEDESVSKETRAQEEKEEIGREDDDDNNRNRNIELDDEDARLEKELYDLIGSLNEELNSII